jgi:hypothetical protein
MIDSSIKIITSMSAKYVDSLIATFERPDRRAEISSDTYQKTISTLKRLFNLPESTETDQDLSDFSAILLDSLNWSEMQLTKLHDWVICHIPNYNKRFTNHMLAAIEFTKIDYVNAEKHYAIAAQYNDKAAEYCRDYIRSTYLRV